MLFQENIQPEEVERPDRASAKAIVNPPQKRIKSECLSPPPGFFRQNASPTTIAPTTIAPTTSVPTSVPTTNVPTTSIPSTSARPNPLAPAQPKAAFLPLFNQEAAKRRVSIEYLFEFNGQSHAGQWTAKCIGEPCY